MKFKVFGNELANVVQVLDKMVDEVVLKADSEDGLIIEVMNIERTVFSKIHVAASDVEPGKVAVTVKDLKMISKMFKGNDVEFDSTKLEGFVIVSDGKRKVKIPQIEVDDLDMPELPEFETTVRIELTQKEFSQILKDVKQFTDAVRFDGGKVIAVSSTHEYEYEIETAEGEGKIVVGVPLLELPLKMKAKQYVLRFADETPMIVEAIGDMANAVFVIAPRVEE